MADPKNILIINQIPDNAISQILFPLMLKAMPSLHKLDSRLLSNDW